jgi:hypothetical protein
VILYQLQREGGAGSSCNFLFLISVIVSVSLIMDIQPLWPVELNTFITLRIMTVDDITKRKQDDDLLFAWVILSESLFPYLVPQ